MKLEFCDFHDDFIMRTFEDTTICDEKTKYILIPVDHYVEWLKYTVKLRKELMFIFTSTHYGSTKKEIYQSSWLQRLEKKILNRITRVRK